MNGSEGSTYPNLWGTMKTMLRGEKNCILMHLLDTGMIENEQNALSNWIKLGQLKRYSNSIESTWIQIIADVNIENRRKESCFIE